MATWELNVNNSNNGRTTVYVMEDDESGIITTPEDLFKNTCFSSRFTSPLAMRFYTSLAIGGTNFPPICKEIAGGATGTLIIAANTSAVKVWTYSNGVWTARSNVTRGISNGATIAIPRL